MRDPCSSPSKRGLSQLADAKIVDPETKRTLPVITKPDLIDEGAEEGVKQLLLGHKTEFFKKGFHMVKGRGQASLNRKHSIEDGLKEEETFFATTQPWCDFKTRNLFGIKELRKKLGELQIQLIRSALPAILKDIQILKLESESDLLAMGTSCETTMEKRQFYREATRTIVKRVQSLLVGKGVRAAQVVGSAGQSQTASAAFHEKCEIFKQALHEGRLASIASVRVGDEVIATEAGKEFHGCVIHASKDGTAVFLDVSDATGNEHIFIKEHFPAGSTNEVPGRAFIDGAKSCIARGDGQYDVLRAISNQKVRRDPDWIRALINKHRPYELPVFVSVDVFNFIVETFILEDWIEPCNEFVASVSELLKETYSRAIDETVSLRRYPRLKQHFTRRFEQGLEKLVARAKEDVQNYAERETIPYTQNEYLAQELGKLRSKWIEENLIDALGLHKFGANEEMSKKSIKATIEAIFRRNRDKAIDAHMAEDMEHVLSVYGKIVAKRFVDAVPMICGALLQKFAESMDDDLHDVATEELHQLIADSREFQENYTSLQRKNKDLTEGLVILNELY